MKTTQDYYSVLKGIEARLGITGATSEILAQLLSQALYYSEVENISYSQEASLERASQENSKIQHCVDRMYSVVRGTCPRVLLKFIPSKVFSWTIGDAVVETSYFKLYYESYWDPQKKDWCNSELTVTPTDSEPKIIKCIISKEFLGGTQTVTAANTTFVEFPWSDLSNDELVSIDGQLYETTRLFSKHVEDPEKTVFDLTIPDFGLRIYAPDLLKANSTVAIAVHRYCHLSDFTESELKNIRFRDGDLTAFDQDADRDLLSSLSATYEFPGIICLEASDRDPLTTVHYKANRERYSSSVYRSNSDLAYLLAEEYPEYVKTTTYKFTGLNSTVEENKTKYYTFIPQQQTIKEESLLKGSKKEGSDGILSITAAPGVTTSTSELKIKDGVSYSSCIVLASAETYIEADSQFPLVRNIIRLEGTGKWTITYSGKLFVKTNLFLDSKTYESEVLETIELESQSPYLYLYGDSANVYDIVLETLETEVKYSRLSQSDVVNTLSLYYIPFNSGIYLSDSQISDFISKKRGYYITDNINVYRGTKVKATVNIKLEIYSNMVSIESDVSDIIDSGYSDQFNLDLETQKDYMKALLQKISNVKIISKIDISYQTESGDSLSWDQIKPNLDTTYFEVTHLLNTSVA